MIDTICLLVPLRSIDQKNNARFLSLSGPLKQIIKPSRALGIYSPKMTILRGRFYPSPVIKIEFSAPKLVFGNNLEELSGDHFDKVVSELKNRLDHFGIRISESDLTTASVSAVHYSKNILLKTGYTANYLISELSKVNYCKRFGASHVRYQNDGSALYLHNKSHELVIYDKVADLRQSRDRKIGENLLLAKVQNSAIEILRFEIRFCKKRKLNDFLVGIGGNKDPTFRDIFNCELSQKIITHYWQKIIQAKESGLFAIRGDPSQFLREIKRAKPDITSKQILYFAGLLMLARETGGFGELRATLSSTDDRDWQRLLADYKDVTACLGEIPRDWLSQIDTALMEFQPITGLPP